MDQKQFEKRMAWLDEQQRKTNESIKEVSQLLKESRKQVETQAKQIAELGDEVARLAGLTTRIHQVDETLQQHRKEVSRQLEDAENRRSEKEANLDALRKSDTNAISLRLDQFQEQMKRVSEIEQTLSTRRDEEIRLSKEAATLNKRMEKQEDLITAQGDQIKSIAREQEKTIKAVQKSSSELETLRKKAEEHRGKLEVLADGNRSLDVRIAELTSSESERTEGQARWVERQELSIVEFENAWKKWGRRFDAIELQATEFDERLAAYEEMHRALKQIRSELGELMERLERRITEVSEMQRLGDQRMKHEWSSFQAEDLKRWNTYKLTSDELWREHTRLHDQLKLLNDSLSTDLDQARENILQLLDADRLRLGELLSMFREWVSEVDNREG